MVVENKYIISLTGKESHKLKIEAGQGSFSIGTKGISIGKYDAFVEKEDKIYWNSFDEFYTPSGSPWPRYFRYSGNDIGFIEWSKKREIEGFTWRPYNDVLLNLEESKIREFSLCVEKYNADLILGKNIHGIILSGELENIKIKKCSKIPKLRFVVDSVKNQEKYYKIPSYSILNEAECVNIYNSPLSKPFDCTSLLQFKNLKNLGLIGNLVNVNILKELKNLESLEIRYVPDLTELPELITWKNLKYFIAWNVEEDRGKILKKELSILTKEREFEYATVSKLRKKIWFTTEYGIPFANWEEKSSKKAIKLYKIALKEIKKAKTENEVEEAIIKLIKEFNLFTNIETTEREDVMTAITQLTESSKLKISVEKGKEWFEQNRDF